jgi:hypothetical protein
LLGFKVEDTTDETLAALDHPFAQKLREYRYARWLDSTYGHDFLRHVAADGRVYADWNQLGNVAGGNDFTEIPDQGAGACRQAGTVAAAPGRAAEAAGAGPGPDVEGGRRRPKDVTKKKLGRSPDGMDVVNLAFYETSWEPPPVIDTPRPRLDPEARQKPGGTVTSFDGYPAVILDEPEVGRRRRTFFHDF